VFLGFIAPHGGPKNTLRIPAFSLSRTDVK
jgi:hypothetical protein